MLPLWRRIQRFSQISFAACYTVQERDRMHTCVFISTDLCFTPLRITSINQLPFPPVYNISPTNQDIHRLWSNNWSYHRVDSVPVLLIVPNLKHDKTSFSNSRHSSTSPVSPWRNRLDPVTSSVYSKIYPFLCCIIRFQFQCVKIQGKNLFLKLQRSSSKTVLSQQLSPLSYPHQDRRCLWYWDLYRVNIRWSRQFIKVTILSVLLYK